MNTTMTDTTLVVGNWEDTIALAMIAAWSFGLVAFVNAFGNHHRVGQWRTVGQYQAYISAKPTILYEQTTPAGETVWRYKTAQTTWAYPRAAAVQRRARGIDLWTIEESSSL